MTLKLPLLQQHDAALQKCVYCPKLSRAACPISNVEASETVTPWGKMSMAYFAARGDVPIEPVYADPAWACSACYACRERCDHKNEVATVLSDARADLFARGVAPPAAKRVAETFSRIAEGATAAAGALVDSRRAPPLPDAPALLVGCTYLRRAPEVARDAVAVADRLLGSPVRVVSGCCGLPLLHAGDRDGFLAAARSLVRDVAGAPRWVVVDPGCARAIIHEYPRLGVDRAAAPPPELLLDVALASPEVRPLPERAAPAGRVRWHDPCQLGRGLGRFDEPRRLIQRLTGSAPEEFLRTREHGECSGAGGILPATRPETSRAIADGRIEEHRGRGGGLLVTGCASSLHRFRSRGEPAMDLVSLVARSLDVAP